MCVFGDFKIPSVAACCFRSERIRSNYFDKDLCRDGAPTPVKGAFARFTVRKVLRGGRGDSVEEAG